MGYAEAPLSAETEDSPQRTQRESRGEKSQHSVSFFVVFSVFSAFCAVKSLLFMVPNLASLTRDCGVGYDVTVCN
jgi:hypothetical protein